MSVSQDNKNGQVVKHLKEIKMSQSGDWSNSDLTDVILIRTFRESTTLADADSLS
jgi:hypothetical protein